MEEYSMQLRDLLSNEDLNKLKRVSNKLKKDNMKKERKGKKNSKDKKENSHKKNERNFSSKKIGYKENEENKMFIKKKRIDECPYCGCPFLDITGNDYYVCEECGVKVEKR